ncbi:Uncharacterised protein [Bordetella pertussis]|nr:Uncharacterised protein [Bordetella pertussis]
MRSTSADTWGGASFLPRTSTHASPLSALTIEYGIRSMSFWTAFSSNLRPIRRLTAYRVFLGLATAWRLAGAPTSVSPSSM